MADRSLSSLFAPAPRYLRSTHLERDFHDPRALDSYVLTDHARECLDVLAQSVQPDSTRRALRLTGDYGSGKSSFALFAAHWLAGTSESRTKEAAARYTKLGLKVRPNFLPVLVTGSREPLGAAIVRALYRAFLERHTRGQRPRLLVELELATKRAVTDAEVESLVIDAIQRSITEGFSGLFLVLDELGKFLEYAAFHPERQDVFLLQRLAEVAARSGKRPFLLVGLLHQAFEEYADSLSEATQREWSKIAGRFEDILFDQPLAQVVELMASALKVDTRRLIPSQLQEATRGFKSVRNLGWFGPGIGKADVSTLAARMFPLHASVVPVLVRVFGTFAQNERSLFSFLLANEPYSLQQFAAQSPLAGGCYRLPHFYDYVRANLGRKLAAQSYRSHWTQIEALVESFSSGDSLEYRIMKVVGLLNLIDHPDLLPTEEAIVAALSEEKEDRVVATLENLTRKKGALFRRGRSGSFRLWCHANVDLQGSLERATKAIGTKLNVARALKDCIEARPLVARRHYIRTGNLRYFNVRYVPVPELGESLVQIPNGADGAVVIALCETAAECEDMRRIATSNRSKEATNVLIGVPRQPLSHLTGLVAEVQRWEWVKIHTHELQTDAYARQEVLRALAAAKLTLQRRVENLIGLRSLRDGMELQWYCAGKRLPVRNARELLTQLSTVCDELYGLAPVVKNELINRGGLSSAAAAARMRLIERIFEFSAEPLLGMNPSKKPPEMSIYRSVIQRASLHREFKGKWSIQLPSQAEDATGILPLFKHLSDVLRCASEQRVNVADLLISLGRPPIGVKAGLAPLYLAVFTACHSDELAFFEENSFVREVGGPMFQRLLKAPETFEVQLCSIKGLRSEVFEALIDALGYAEERTESSRLLQVVRPLCQFVAQLPDYSRTTKRLSPGALSTREAILTSQEPAKLLFHDLPVACGHEPFSSTTSSQAKAARTFAQSLKRYVDELRDSYRALLMRLATEVQTAFRTDAKLQTAREGLAARAAPLAGLSNDSPLRTLCLRLADLSLDQDAWLESLASTIVAQPPKRWRDTEEDTFVRELSNLAARFRNLESIAFDQPKFARAAQAYRLAVTRADGAEAHEVVYVDSAYVNDVAKLSTELRQLVADRPTVALAAISNVVWEAINGRKR